MLGHRDWARAKRQADEVAAGFIDAPKAKAEAESEPLSLERLFDIYSQEVNEHITPITAEAHAALEEARRRRQPRKTLEDRRRACG